MAIANFGMDLRPTSSVVQTDDELRAARAAAEAQQSALFDQFGQQRLAEAHAMGFTNLGQDYASLVRDAVSRQPNATDWISRIGSSAPQGLEQAQQTFGQTSATLAARPQAQQTQQSAYNTSTLGGGVSGGVLPGISAQGTMDPTQQASWNTPWMQPGFGNPGSLGGLGGYKPQTGQQQQNTGWGGVFGQKNPWSMA